MGGDQAPLMVLKGADKSLKRYPQAEFLLFGDEAKIKPLLAKMPRLTRRSQICHTDAFVTNEAKPSLALRTGRRSSMRLAIDAVAEGSAAVVVPAGFPGNLAPRTAEGTARLFSTFLRAAFKHSLLARIGYLFAADALKKMRERMDPRRYNGAMLLGLNGIAVKSHGGADALGFANAIGVAVDMKINGFVDQIRDELARLHAIQPPPQTAAL